MQNIKPMQIAVEQAKLALKKNEVPIGAVIIRKGELIATSHNMMRANNDILAHAEINVIKQAMAILGTDRLVECDIYVTLEPCTMCAGAISLARLKRLYYGASDHKFGAIEHGARFFAQPTCHHKPEIYPSIEEQQCKLLLQQFFQAKR